MISQVPHQPECAEARLLPGCPVPKELGERCTVGQGGRATSCTWAAKALASMSSVRPSSQRKGKWRAAVSFECRCCCSTLAGAAAGPADWGAHRLPLLWSPPSGPLRSHHATRSASRFRVSEGIPGMICEEVAFERDLA